MIEFSQTRHGGNTEVFDGYPGFWCDWVPTDDRLGIEWNGSEKFYSYTEWLQLIVSRFLEPNGYKLNGEVMWRGEDFEDRGILVAYNNEITEVSR